MKRKCVVCEKIYDQQMGRPGYTCSKKCQKIYSRCRELSPDAARDRLTNVDLKKPVTVFDKVQIFKLVIQFDPAIDMPNIEYFKTYGDLIRWKNKVIRKKLETYD